MKLLFIIRGDSVTLSAIPTYYFQNPCPLPFNIWKPNIWRTKCKINSMKGKNISSLSNKQHLFIKKQQICWTVNIETFLFIKIKHLVGHGSTNSSFNLIDKMNSGEVRLTHSPWQTQTGTQVVCVLNQCSWVCYCFPIPAGNLGPMTIIHKRDMQ